MASLSKCLLFQSSRFDWHLELGRLRVVPCTLHVLMMDLVVLQGILRTLEIFLYPSPDVCLKLEPMLLPLCESALKGHSKQLFLFKLLASAPDLQQPKKIKNHFWRWMLRCVYDNKQPESIEHNKTSRSGSWMKTSLAFEHRCLLILQIRVMHF